MLLIPCPWCGPRDEVEFRYGGQAGSVVPGRPRGAVRRGVGRLPVHARQPEGRLRRALVHAAGLPALVQRRARHGDRRDPRSGSARRRRHETPRAGGDADRPVDAPLSFTFDGRERPGSRATRWRSALLANGVDVVCRSPILGRPRGRDTRRARRSRARSSRSTRRRSSRSSPRRRVDLVDGLDRARPLPGVGRLPGRARARARVRAPPCARRDAGGRRGRRQALGRGRRRGGDRGDRVACWCESTRLACAGDGRAATSTCSPTRPRSASTTTATS